jgi:hypothetical protein
MHGYLCCRTWSKSGDKTVHIKPSVTHYCSRFLLQLANAFNPADYWFIPHALHISRRSCHTFPNRGEEKCGWRDGVRQISPSLLYASYLLSSIKGHNLMRIPVAPAKSNMRDSRRSLYNTAAAQRELKRSLCTLWEGACVRQSVASFRGVARRMGRCCGLPGSKSLTGGKTEGKLWHLKEKINFCAQKILNFEINLNKIQ